MASDFLKGQLVMINHLTLVLSSHVLPTFSIIVRIQRRFVTFAANLVSKFFSSKTMAAWSTNMVHRSCDS